MNRQIARLGTALLVAFGLLFLQLNWLTVFHAQDLKDNPANSRELLRTFDGPRGTISSADGVVLAQTVASESGDRFETQRVYPEGELFAHSVGFFSLNLGTSGVERSRNNELVGETDELVFERLSDLFVNRSRAEDLTLTLRKDVQEVARAELGDRQGSVVALDPRTGAVLAMWSFPSFDPNLLADHDTTTATAVQVFLDAIPEKPLLAKSYRERYFPGSTFKVITGSAGVQSGAVTPTTPSFPVTNAFVPPQTTRPIRNFGGSTCGGDLFQILKVSCNTAFAQMGVDLGPETMIAAAEAFGFNRKIPIDLPDAARSNFPTDFDQDLPALAQSSIGQNDVSATPLQMAMTAAAIANNGSIMTPHVLAEARDGEGAVVSTFEPSEFQRAIAPETATIMRDAMVGVAGPGGTAQGLAIEGFEVGGKTGTAQLGTEVPSSHAWIIGFAGPPGQPAQVAVAVIVEGQPGASEQTGGRVAAPIARAVLLQALQGI